MSSPALPSSTPRRPTPEQEREWSAGLRAGEVAAFTALRDATLAELLAFAMRYVDGDTAEDIVQDVLFAIWRRRETIVFQAGVRAYLFGAVRQEALLRARRATTRRDAVTAEVEGDRIPAMGTPPPSPESAAIAGELRAALHAALETLPERQRTVLIMRWSHGLSYEEIASAIGIAEAAARQLVSRAQRLLRPVVSQLLGAEPAEG